MGVFSFCHFPHQLYTPSSLLPLNSKTKSNTNECQYNGIITRESEEMSKEDTQMQNQALYECNCNIKTLAGRVCVFMFMMFLIWHTNTNQVTAGAGARQRLIGERFLPSFCTILWLNQFSHLKQGKVLSVVQHFEVYYMQITITVFTHITSMAVLFLLKESLST